MRDLLDRRNLLTPRSPLAAKSASHLGRNLVTDVSEPVFVPLGDAAPASADSPAAPSGGFDAIFWGFRPSARATIFGRPVISISIRI
jgi:hypothetical protein